MNCRARNLVFLFFPCLFLFMMSPSYSQTDTLAQGQELKHGDQLFSASGIFRLGFFKPGRANNSYLGIWHNKDNDRAAVWVANRDIPIYDNSGTLVVDDHGNLKISYNGGVPIVLYSVQAASMNTSAILFDTGNFVLRELNPDGSIKKELWESFDSPSDTLLPNMKLGVNRRSGHNWSLTSWISDEVPDLGSFTLGMDPNGMNQLVIWWRGNIYWTSGPWHNRSVNLLDKFLHYNFSYISNEDELYFTYSVNKDITIFPRITLDARGELRSLLTDSMFTQVSCTSAVSLRAGCVEQKLPECRSHDDKFVSKLGFMANDGFTFNKSDNMSLSDCWLQCLKNCSCIAYASANDDGTGCAIWSKTSSFTENNTRKLRNVFILDSTISIWWIWLIIVCGGASTIPLLCSVCFVMWRKKQAEANRLEKMQQAMLLRELGGNAMSSTLYGKLKKHRRGQKASPELQIFSFESISDATNNFSTANKLGEGGFGPVYKGKLLDGQKVAIKRLSRSSGQGLVEFKNEAVLIAKLQHTNLVRLLGFCIQGEEKILIYEYMPNKSLDCFLFDSNKKKLLNWKKRLSIIQGITQGLIYLHKYSRLRVIHRDLKVSNILLDNEMNPKISDFGMARIFGLNETEENTNRVVGTFGYMSPEYAMKGIVSIKTDVFSFGVILLEIVSGKKNNSYCHSERSLNLIGYAWQLWNENRALEIIDSTLDEPYPHNEALRCIHAGLLCVQDRATDRPTMSEVVSMLSNENILLPAPKQPAFFVDTIEEIQDVPKQKSESCSTNDVTISVIDAR